MEGEGETVHSVQSTMMGRSQHVGRLQRFTQYRMMGRSQHVGRLQRFTQYSLQ